MAVFPSDSIRTKNWGTEILTDADLEAQLDLLHAYFTAALNSSTGHTHDGTSNQGPTLTYAGVTSTFGNGFTTVTAASGDSVLIATDVSDSNKTKKALVSDIVTLSTFTPSASNALAGSIVQIVNTQTGAVATGTTTIPKDDTIPQNTEGDQYMTLAITPTSATNKLKIDVCINVCGGNTAAFMVAALFQDATANALASAFSVATPSTANLPSTIYFTHYMTSGTTSATTFKVRAGIEQAGTTTFNGASSARLYGGVLASSITITEIKV